jgi:hypothetical protein
MWSGREKVREKEIEGRKNKDSLCDPMIYLSIEIRDRKDQLNEADKLREGIGTKVRGRVADAIPGGGRW